ncbi:cytochrome b [Qipengyuania sp. DY56-A-20]|jgi:cytochrome b561|uniref:Cytochrome b n=1 Tax=Qipengyuania benthica TaxID=3067651 RepID=A0ABT9HC94_9SPHN|nr:cytochrome b [Qipengyuania sp. DY56-A-20]MDP4540946.1 cytochrome b [Qipengyuania sp. DY56-A-20]
MNSTATAARTTARRYSLVAMLFHWLIALAVIVNWRLAEAAEHAGRADAIWYFANHKALGMVILLLTLGRLIWRWIHPVPPLPGDLARWEKVLARSVHIVFYVLLIALPLGGWLATSLNGGAIDMFGAFAIPALPVGLNEDLGETIFDAHSLGGSIMVYLIGLHILGALKHTLFDRNGGIFRMLPFGRVPG